MVDATVVEPHSSGAAEVRNQPKSRVEHLRDLAVGLVRSSISSGSSPIWQYPLRKADDAEQLPSGVRVSQ